MAKQDKEKKKNTTTARAAKSFTLPSTMRKKNVKNNSTQQFLPFREIRDDMTIMKDGTLRTVLLVSSINFALKSEDEQKAIIQGYVGFLNTLDFELQIVVQSRKLNIDGYLEDLQNIARQQDNELLRKQTLSYRAFVSKMVEEADIMDKKFFVVVPYSPFTGKRKNFWTRAREVLTPTSSVKLSQAKLNKHKLEMDRRVQVVLGGLQSIGLQAQVLDTQSLIELYYNTYNPSSRQQNRIEDINEMQIDRTIQ